MQVRSGAGLSAAPSGGSVRRFFVARRYTLAKALNLGLAVAVLAGFSSWAAQAAAYDAAVAEQVAAAERAAARGPYAADGTFTGAAQGFGGPVKMQVVIDNGHIAAVDILDAGKEDDAWLAMARVLPGRIVQAQGADIDVVTGATYTSAGILNAVTEALGKSMEAGGA